MFKDYQLAQVSGVARRSSVFTLDMALSHRQANTMYN